MSSPTVSVPESAPVVQATAPTGNNKLDIS